MKDDTILWDDPPASATETKRYLAVEALLESVKANPGRWAKWPRLLTSGAYSSLRSRSPGLEWRWAANEDDPTKRDVWVRCPQ